MKRFMPVFSRRTLVFTTSAVASVFFLMGCGGGSDSPAPNPSTSPSPVVSPSPVASPSPTVSGRAALIDSVKGARKAANLFGSPSEIFGRSASPQNAGMLAARRIIVYAQIAKTKKTRQAGLEFDDASGLYISVAQVEGGFRLNYFEDAAGKTLAGFVEFKEVDEKTIQMVFNLPKGQQASMGTLTLVSENAEGTWGTIKGDLTDPNTGEKVTFNLEFHPGNAGGDDVSVNGSFSVTDTDGTIAFENLVADEDGSMSVDLSWNGTTGEMSGAADKSGWITLGTGANKIRAEWDTAGKGKIILSDNTVINVDDFDTADGEG